jgi:hypothetical protein
MATERKQNQPKRKLSLLSKARLRIIGISRCFNGRASTLYRRDQNCRQKPDARAGEVCLVGVLFGQLIACNDSTTAPEDPSRLVLTMHPVCTAPAAAHRQWVT